MSTTSSKRLAYSPAKQCVCTIWTIYLFLIQYKTRSPLALRSVPPFSTCLIEGRAERAPPINRKQRTWMLDQALTVPLRQVVTEGQILHNRIMQSILHWGTYLDFFSGLWRA